MLNFHVRVHWSKENDWSGWVKAEHRCEAISILVEAIVVKHGIDVPYDAEITIRQGTPTY